MRISDWSSDVCSSDLRPASAFNCFPAVAARAPATGVGGIVHVADMCPDHRHIRLARQPRDRVHVLDLPGIGLVGGLEFVDADRKRVVEGQSVSVRVDLGGRRIIKKKKNKYIPN